MSDDMYVMYGLEGWGVKKKKANSQSQLKLNNQETAVKVCYLKVERAKSGSSN